MTERFWLQEAKPSVTDAAITDLGSSVNREYFRKPTACPGHPVDPVDFRGYSDSP